MAPVTFTQRAQIAAGLAVAAGPVGDCFDKLLAGVNLVDDTQLASPTNAVWRTVQSCHGPVGPGGVALSTSLFYFGTTSLVASGGGGAATAQGIWVPPSAGDIAVVSKTTRMRLRVPFGVNGVAPGITITWGLYPVTMSGSGAMILTLGTVVAGSTAVATTPALGTAAAPASAGFDFSVLVAGAYIFGVTGSGTQAANSVVSSQPILEMRHT